MHGEFISAKLELFIGDGMIDNKITVYLRKEKLYRGCEFIKSLGWVLAPIALLVQIHFNSIINFEFIKDVPFFSNIWIRSC
jgi:hypothetical protein